MENVNELTVVRGNFHSEEEYNEMLGQVLRILLANRQIVSVVDEGCGVVVFRYSHEDLAFGCPYPYWLTPEEIELVDEYRFDKKE